MQNENNTTASCSKVDADAIAAEERSCIATNEAATPLKEHTTADTPKDSAESKASAGEIWGNIAKALAEAGVFVGEKISGGVKSVAAAVSAPFRKKSAEGELQTNKESGRAASKVKRGYLKTGQFAKDFVSRKKYRPMLAMCATCIVAVTAVIVMSLNFSIGFEVVANGQVLGIVDSEQKCIEIIDEVNRDLEGYFGEEGKIAPEITSTPILIAKDDYTPDAQVKESVCQLSDKMTEVPVIYANGEPVVAVANMDAAKQLFANFEDFYTGGKEGVVFSTETPLEIHSEMVPMYNVKNVDEALNLLNGSEKQANMYAVKAGETLWSISSKYDLTVDELVSLNDGLTEDIDIGDELVVKCYIPVVKVTTTQRAEYSRKIPYEVERRETDTMYQGKVSIAQEGVNGEEYVVADIIKENGQEVRRDILSSDILSEPVTEIKMVGTAPPPTGYGSGSFIPPVSGVITSRMGYRRSGYHKGLDIANSYGTPIRACDNGVVIAAGWSGLFGILVKIDHQNGFITYYGHNSSLAVRVGEVVEQGEVIAYMGSTGNSTGNHCHLEMYYNGTLVNPEKYIY